MLLPVTHFHTHTMGGYDNLLSDGGAMRQSQLRKRALTATASGKRKTFTPPRERKLLLGTGKAVAKRYIAKSEENEPTGMLSGSIRPPNKMTLKLKYKDEWTQQPVLPGAHATVWSSFNRYYPNALFAPNAANAALGTGPPATTQEPIPWLVGYAGMWNRALVIKADYTVTFVNTNSNTLRAYIAFTPYTTTLTQATSTAGTWSTLDAQLNSNANQQYIVTEALGPSGTPQSQETLFHGKYLPDLYGEQDVYYASLDNTVSGAPKSTQVDFTQQFQNTQNPITSAPFSNNVLVNPPLTVNPNSLLNVYVGTITTANAAPANDISVYQFVKATLTVMFFRNNLQWN